MTHCPRRSQPFQVNHSTAILLQQGICIFLTGDKERRIALSISKLKAARYLDFGLEELVPSLWVESERVYDISASDGNHSTGGLEEVKLGWDVDKSHEKHLDQMLKTFICSSTIKQWRPRKWPEDEQEEKSKDFITAIDKKTTDQKEFLHLSSNSGKLLLEEE
ncbi:hypothetical protein Tco_0413200 [Tanacetum coccineum]